MKDLKNLKGAKVISKMEQKVIKGGLKQCDDIHYFCPEGYACINGVCKPAILP